VTTASAAVLVEMVIGEDRWAPKRLAKPERVLRGIVRPADLEAGTGQDQLR